ncbi:MAG: hypothetical protein WDO56_26130 [Gammaproteobacteria bacterium]
MADPTKRAAMLAALEPVEAATRVMEFNQIFRKTLTLWYVMLGALDRA